MGPSSPAISVVVSTYNDASHLAESIESVLSQDFADFEFIIVNDGSPDPRTGEILARYSTLDPRIRVITKQNEGLTKALIDGCAAARGEHIARLDVGDTMTPERLQLQRAFLESHADVVFVSCWTEFCGPKWEQLNTEKGRDTGPDGMAILPLASGENLTAGPTCHPSVMFRRAAYEAAGGYRWQFYYGQDWDLWYRLAERGRFHIIPQVLYRVRVLPQGISATNRDRQDAISECWRDVCRCRALGLDEAEWLARAATIRPAGGSSPKCRSRSEGCYLVGEQLRRNGDPRCRRYLIEAIRQRPADLRPWVRLLQTMVRGLFMPRSRSHG